MFSCLLHSGLLGMKSCRILGSTQYTKSIKFLFSLFNNLVFCWVWYCRPVIPGPKADVSARFPLEFLFWKKSDSVSSPCNPDLCVPLQLLWECCSPRLPVSTSQVAVLPSWFLLSTELPNITFLCFSRSGSGSGIRSASDRECCLGGQGRFLAAGKPTVPDSRAKDCWLPSDFQQLRSLEREQLLISLTIQGFSRARHA